VEAQIDRFMFRLHLDYPTAEEERELIDRIQGIQASSAAQVTSPEQIRELASHISKVHVNEDMKTYMVDLVRKTRDMKEIRLGGSPRSALHLYSACRAKALVEGRDYVVPDDVKELLEPILNHRMWLSRETETEGLKVEDIVRRIVTESPIPGARPVGQTQ
jgi:MoxR-like ATPase